MEGQIPWHIIGPAGCLAIVILIIVFAFLVKFQKKNSHSTIPKDLNSISKKSICFKHEGDIAANKTAIEMVGEHLAEATKFNREDHGKIFKMMEDNQKDIIKHIDARNAKK